jgi:hypothetical protein
MCYEYYNQTVEYEEEGKDDWYVAQHRPHNEQEEKQQE